MIDPFVDKVLVVGTYVFFASNHFAIDGRSITGVQAWMVVIILIRELLVTDLRMISESRGTSFGANFYGKLKMVVQSAAILWILLSLVIGGLTTSGPWYHSRLFAACLAGGGDAAEPGGVSPPRELPSGGTVTRRTK